MDEIILRPRINWAFEASSQPMKLLLVLTPKFGSFRQSQLSIRLPLWQLEFSVEALVFSLGGMVTLVFRPFLGAC